MRQVGLRLPEELFGRVEASRGDVPRNRFICRVLEEALGGVGPDQPMGGDSRGPVTTAPVARPASPRAPKPASVLEVEGMKNIAASTSHAVRERLQEQVDEMQQGSSKRQRACSVCGEVVTSPSLVRHPLCGGKVVPEPES